MIDGAPPGFFDIPGLDLSVLDFEKFFLFDFHWRSQCARNDSFIERLTILLLLYLDNLFLAQEEPIIMFLTMVDCLSGAV